MRHNQPKPYRKEGRSKYVWGWSYQKTASTLGHSVKYVHNKWLIAFFHITFGFKWMRHIKKQKRKSLHTHLCLLSDCNALITSDKALWGPCSPMWRIKPFKNKKELISQKKVSEMKFNNCVLWIRHWAKWTESENCLVSF